MRYPKIILLCLGSVLVFHLARRLTSLYTPRSSLEIVCLTAAFYGVVCGILTLLIHQRNIPVDARRCPVGVWWGVYTLCYVFSAASPEPVINAVIFTVNGLGEEFIFRLFLFNTLAMYVPGNVAGLLSSLAFGAAHANPFASLLNLTYFGDTFLGGCLLWWLYTGYRSVVVAGAFHTFGNVVLTRVPHSFGAYWSRLLFILVLEVICITALLYLARALNLKKTPRIWT